MPKLWTDTIDAHRREVANAIVDATVELAAERGWLAVTMSQIAEATGIGRATLYKYFPDVETILRTWHEQRVSSHLQMLADVRDRAEPDRRVEAVLEAFAAIASHIPTHHDVELASLLHRGDHVIDAARGLRELICDLLAEGARSGRVRDDVAPDDLAAYCLFALAAAGALRSRAAVRGLVGVTMDGLRPPAADHRAARRARR